MARQLRLHVPGGFYHVTLRGNHRQAIFFEEGDRDLLNSIVAEVIASQNARIHAFCWMTNHLHAVIQVSNVPLGRVVLRIASRYARIVQKRLATTGHLFERRYHCVLVDAEEYLLTLIRYVHLNPIKAGLTSDLASFHWSSHADYLGHKSHPWVTTDFALRLLASERCLATVRYRDLITGVDPTKWGEELLPANRAYPQVLGGDDFAARVTGGLPAASSRRSLDDLAAESCCRFAVSAAMLISPFRSRSLTAARAWLGHEALASRSATISAVARYLQRSESSLRELMARHPRRELPDLPQIRESATRHYQERRDCSQRETSWISGRHTWCCIGYSFHSTA
jgi:putative transposase